MNRVRHFLERWGLHAFLLPIFFITHTYQQYYGLVSANVAIKLGIIIMVAVIVLFVLILLLTRHVNKTLQMVTLISFVILFFGLIKDFLRFTIHAFFLSRYSVLLPFLVVATVFLLWIIVRKKDFRKNNLFQNILVLLFLLADIVNLILFDHSVFLNKNLLVKNKFTGLSTARPRSIEKKPDVYFLVFDSYPGTSFLSEFMNYDNSSFNQQLEDKGFYVVKKPKSNYNRTAFSLASTLNFEYLRKLKENNVVNAKDYAQANLTIKEAIVPRFFKAHNYSLYNLSVFDIDKVPAVQKETFLTMPEQNILLYNTLPERIKNDLLWNFLTGKFAVRYAQKVFVQSKDEFKKKQQQKDYFNRVIVDSLMKITVQKTEVPKFVYAHLYLPHPPFFYNEYGAQNDLSYIMTEASLENKDLFLSYLKYTNKIILKLINEINSAAGKESIIIIQSDHGFRDFAGWQKHPEYFFRNYSAFYFPDKDYSNLYDSVSNINTFPIIFNKYFNTNITLQKDSCIFLIN